MDIDYIPIECLQTDRQLVPLLPPHLPTGVLEARTVCDLILLLGHISPQPSILPIVREVFDSATQKGLVGSVVGHEC